MKNLRIMIRRMRITVTQFAGEIGVTPVAVFYWISGKTRPTKAHLESVKKYAYENGFREDWVLKD
ncbi:MAG: helix-turn-helix domain-containing protein [Candidatus Thorarchaeota archaeon]